MLEKNENENEISNTDRIGHHLRSHLGGNYGVFHQMLTFGMHIDIYYWAPIPERNFWVLCSVGMSSAQMNVRDKKKQFCEIMMFLDPEDWNLNMRSIMMLGSSLKDTPLGDLSLPIQGYPVAKRPDGSELLSEAFMSNVELSWPMINIQKITRFPFIYQAWLSDGHVIDMEAQRIGMYQGWIIKTPELISEDILDLKLDKRKINFYVAFPISITEIEIAQKSGSKKLMKMFKHKQVSEITHQKRECIYAKTKRGKKFYKLS